MQLSTSSFSIRIADWRLDGLAIQAIREEVFIKELGIPAELEWDGRDPSAIQLLVEDQEGQAIATARMLTKGHIGRMAVLEPWRKKGIGTAMIKALLEVATQSQLESIFLNAREEIVPFFLNNGFKPEGAPFLEAGIPHQLMVRALEVEPFSKTAYLEQPQQIDGSLEQIDSGILGETEREVSLKSRAAFQTAYAALARQARKKILIFTYDLDGDLYDNENMLSGVRRLATRNPDPSVFILLQNNERAQREGHRLVGLANRLPSKIKIFRPMVGNYQEHTENFMLADDEGFVYRKWYTRLEGRVEFHNRTRTRELAGFFQEAWNESEEDIALRRLSI